MHSSLTLSYSLIFQVYVCEDCGHSTAEPENHFKHLQQNHPYNPALTRCHDKRQFKFNKHESSSTSATESSVTTSVSASVSEQPGAAQRQPLAETRDVNETVHQRRQEVSAPSKACDELPFQRYRTLANSGDTASSTASSLFSDRDIAPHLKDMNSLTDKGANSEIRYCDIRLAPKRGIANSPKSSPVKTAPKQLKPSSPMKVRPLNFGLCENSVPAIPRLDNNTENTAGKHFNTDGQFKKRPLGSLTQNTIQNEGNAQRQIRFDVQRVLAPMNQLGNKLGSNKW